MLGSDRKQGVDRGVTDRTERRGRRRLAALICGIVAIAVLPAGAAHAATWEIGDVFAGVVVAPDGTNHAGYRVFDNNGNFKEFVGRSDLSGGATGCRLDANNDLIGTFFHEGVVVRFSSVDPHPDFQTITFPGGNTPESVALDAAGNFYIGNAHGDLDVYKYDLAGNFLDQFNVATGPEGSDHIDLAADQKTLFYTSEGRTVFRYDTATKTQLADFATLPGDALQGEESYGLRILPPGDGSGGVLVADSDDILRLDGSGNVVQNYDAPGNDLWFALTLDPNGTSFWSADVAGGIFRFNIATGAVEVGPIADNVGVEGLCVSGELTAGVPPPAPGAGSPCANVILGDSKGNNLQGTAGSDAVKGLGGNDKIKAGNGDDCARGGPGHDNVDGGEGDDQVNGGQKPDVLDGGPGDDLMKAIAGRVDIVNCGPGDDTVRAEKRDIVNKDCEKVTG